MSFRKREKFKVYCSCIAAVSAVLLAPDALAQQGPVSAEASVIARYPSGSIHAVDAAELALVEVSKERAEVEHRFVTEKNACLSRFFASSCEEHAKEQRRKTLEELKAVEVEANAFKRQARVDERDRALEEKRVQDEKDRQERARQQEESPRTQRPADSAPKDNMTTAQTEAMASERIAKHDAKLKRIEADEAANAQKRAENISAYQKKVLDAQAHQKEVEKKKAEKERDRAKQQASAP